MFAERLKELRKEKIMTQVQLAEALGVSKGTIAMWEIGKREPNFETLDRLSDIFDKRIDYILGYSNDASSPQFTEEDIDQLGRWEVEDQFREIIMEYLSLDEYGKTAVESLIKAEKLRCHEQQSICNTEDIVLSIRINKSK
ncbi:MAG: helix-turn-helix transcriptional regulator [Clostridia bacterium]|nr:helix-turn-helix transcriptional regulator [Clostridia bacterium]